MGIIKCEKVFAGIFTFSNLFEIKMKVLTDKKSSNILLFKEAKIYQYPFFRT